MTSAFHRFVRKIVKQTDGTEEEQEDLYEEFIIHLEMSSDQLRQEGLSEQEANRMAMKQFGNENDIGKQIQHAMYPYRREMMLGLAIASVIYAAAVYVSKLFIEGDAYITWLLLAMGINICLFVYILQPMPFLNRRLWINSLFIVHLFIYLFGLLLATSLEASISMLLTIFCGLILALGIVLIYRTTVFDYPANAKVKKQVMIIHFINTTIGIVVIAITLFFLWAFLAFSDGLHPVMGVLLIPLSIWILLYRLQIYFAAREKKRIAFTIAAVELLAIFLWCVWIWGGGI